MKCQKKICIACITTDSVMRMEKKNHPQVYLEEWKFINTELKFESESKSESDTELMAKLESASDSE